LPLEIDATTRSKGSTPISTSSAGVAAKTSDPPTLSSDPDAVNDLAILKLMELSGVDPTDENAAYAAQLLNEKLRSAADEPSQDDEEEEPEQTEFELDGVTYEPQGRAGRSAVDQELDDSLPSPGL
jgi:hypothetical protein